MSIYDSAAVLMVLVAAMGYLNYRALRLPSTIGLVIIALLSSLLLLALDRIGPGWHIAPAMARYVRGLDFYTTLMVGMLAFLLFAGSLHMELDRLMEQRWAILGLATAGVLISTAVVGGALYLVLPSLGLQVGLGPCLVMGALISPTDPIAVLSILKEARAPRDIEAIIAGESLFNDGVGVVVFLALTQAFGLGAGHGGGASPGVGSVFALLLQEVGGGVLLGLGLGWVAFLALRSIDEYRIEVQITLALVMAITAISGWLHASGPIAVVLAGLLLGNHGRKLAMSDITVDHLEKFWGLIDEILNAVLFLLIGLEVLTVSLGGRYVVAGLIAVPVVLLARLAAVGVPVAAVGRLRGPLRRGTVPLLTWSGLRGGISVALVLSLPPFPERELLVTMTYVVVLFSILAQGLTIRRVVARLLPAPAVRDPELMR